MLYIWKQYNMADQLHLNKKILILCTHSRLTETFPENGPWNLHTLKKKFPPSDSYTH